MRSANESPNLCRILDTLVRLYATTYINRPGLHLPDCMGNIIHIQPSGEYQRFG
jgi:hypothetical protein